MTPRPVPTRLAGYNPAPVIETGRVPSDEKPETYPVYPPTHPVLGFPAILPPPVIVIPPGEPCDPDDPDNTDPECDDDPDDPDPPVDAPEPAMVLILIAAILAYWGFGRVRQT